MILLIMRLNAKARSERTVLERKAYQRLLEWKSSSQGKTALLVEGARRVGKSTLALEFGRREYSSCVFIDFVDASDQIIDLFTDLRNDLDSFFLYLSAITATPLHERDTLIVFDEVQAYPKAREAIRRLVADGRYDYIETGSLVSIRENVRDIRIPSEERAMDLNPMDFEEFLWAMGERPLADAVRDSFAKRRPLPDALHRKAARLFREYMLVGGMPQAVSEYVEMRDFGRVDVVKRGILSLYRNDIAKHAGRARNRVTAVFDGIPGQLSKHEKKFTLSSLGKGARMREYEDAFFWLSDARIANDCFNSTDPSVGLGMSEDRTLVKCYMADTGLLVSKLFADNDETPHEVYRDILLGKLEINEGMFTENVVAQQLAAGGHGLYFYSKRDREGSAGTMEIDFLVTAGYDNAAGRMRVSPVEVKSTKRYGAKSIEKFKDRFGSRVGVRYILHPKPMSVEGDMVRLPLYMAHLL